ncbi:MAG TPA: hypothetical protein VGR31_09500 [Planctomycetota bacterium]|jgi:hypothetical protein|nr:hypothetical protein [Planctomycetota bacterium]
MAKEVPDHHDAEIVMKLYDLRRESVMRDSRNKIAQFLPRTWEEFIVVTQPAHPLNAAFRQVSSYWEMAYGFGRHHIVNADFLIENTTEGLFIYVKVLPFLERFRKEVSPTAFRNYEWITTQCETGKQRLELVQSRVRKMLETSK